MNGLHRIGRRDFLLTPVFAAAGSAVLPALAAGAERKLRIGVISDIHLHWKKPGNIDCEMFEKALRFFDAEKADGVVLCGDIADSGFVPELEMAAEIWFRVFPDNRRSDGEPVVNLFHYGDHDIWAGLNNSNIARETPDLEKRKSMDIPTQDRRKVWERVWKEPWDRIKVRNVKGYWFLLSNFEYDDAVPMYGDSPALAPLLEKMRTELSGPRPWFYSQHLVLKNTCGGPYMWGQDSGKTGELLAKFPNCVAFCGHKHANCDCDLNVWQGAYTAVAVPSVSYQGTASGRENGHSAGYRRPMASQMYPIDVRKAHQALLMDVYDDRLVIARRDLTHDAKYGPDWVVPLDVKSPANWSFANRAKIVPAPEFPSGSEVTLAAGVGKNAIHQKTEQLTVKFPLAASTEKTPRAYEYEVKAEVRKADVWRTAVEKRVFPPRAIWAEEFEDQGGLCVFAFSELPNDADEYRFTVTPMNSYAVRGRPLGCTVKKFPEPNL